jgi:cation:H+ antiporter
LFAASVFYPAPRFTALNRNRFFIFIACLAAVPGFYARLGHVDFSSPLVGAFVAGLAITSAAFLLLWACDAAQADISQALALAAVALISVLPEYAVDMYFTWQAGQHPESHYASYAVANMTGANRLVIGVAWSLIVIIVWLRQRKPILLQNERRLEIVMLSYASLYALVIPLKGSLTWYDMLVFLGIYVWYITLASRRPVEEVEADGPAAELLNLPKVQRRIATALLFVFAGATILVNAKPFCENLIASGKTLGINEFLLVQWLGPIASEAPEFIVAIIFALRGNGSVALGSLLSAKLNQWTLLVGMIPGVYALSSGSLRHPIPMADFQFKEILLTAAQSILALFMIANLRFSFRYGIVLFVLFTGQIASPWVIEHLPGHMFLGFHADQIHNVFSLLYIIGAVTLLIEHPSRWRALFQLRLKYGREECSAARKIGCHEFPNCVHCGKDREVSAKPLEEGR